MAERDGMFRREVWCMWGPMVLMIVLGLLAAPFVPAILRMLGNP